MQELPRILALIAIPAPSSVDAIFRDLGQVNDDPIFFLAGWRKGPWQSSLFRRLVRGYYLINAGQSILNASSITVAPPALLPSKTTPVNVSSQASSQYVSFQNFLFMVYVPPNSTVTVFRKQSAVSDTFLPFSSLSTLLTRC